MFENYVFSCVHFPLQGLMRIEGAWQPQVLPSDRVGLGSIVIIRNCDRSHFAGMELPFLMGCVFDVGLPSDDKVLVTWMLPASSRRMSLGPGRKGQVVDIFGEWGSIESHTVSKSASWKLPKPLVPLREVLISNVQLELIDGQRCIPFDILHQLKSNHSIDVTALTFSETQRGNLYRLWEMMHLGT